MSTILNKIAEVVTQRVEEEKRKLEPTQLQALAVNSRQPHAFLDAFKGTDLNIIAEVKLASPSEGDIAPGVTPVEVAQDYLENGAAALSVLTEPHFFKGQLTYLKSIREAHPQARLLMKDFVVDEYQLFQARYFGADAALLIVALLELEQLKAFYGLAKELGLTPLVEVHNQAELDIAQTIGAELIGVNNRNLKTMEVSLKTSEALIKMPSDAVMISESGIKNHEDLLHLKAVGYQGFLVGTSLMKTGEPGQSLKKLLGRSDES